MKNVLCTRSFQFHGMMVHSGSTINVEDEELKNEFIAAHVELPRTPAQELPKEKVAKRKGVLTRMAGMIMQHS